MSAAELAEAVRSASTPTLLDVRWQLGGPPGLDEFRRDHIPGAQFVDLDRELAAPPDPGRHPLPGAREFEMAMRVHGVTASRLVVVYDAATGMAAARAWWVLRYFGHPAVRLLDGGIAAWRRAGLPVTAEVMAAAPGDFVARPGGMALLDAAGAEHTASAGVLLDARAPERFRGEAEPIDPIAGHIPGARNVPTAGNVDSNGNFLPAGELRARFAAAGAVPRAMVGAYCGSGVTAAHEVLALAVAGVDAALYAGSWSDWITDASRPVSREP